MTNYSAWDSKATALLREAEEESKKEEEESSKALGLQDGPKGPPTAKAEKEMEDLGNHSNKRKEFIDWSKKREVTLSHKPQEEPIELAGEEVKNKAVKISGSEGVTYVIPSSGIVKLMLDKCKRVRVQVLASIVTSTIEAFHCEDVDFDLAVPVGTMQVDECPKAVNVVFAERDHVGRIYHQNSPGLSLGWGSKDAEAIGKPGEVQLCTRPDSEGAREPLLTAPVRRGEGDFPLDLPGDPKGAPGAPDCEPDAEAAPAAEERRRQADAKREKGNEMFRANDFLQAAMEYTSALELDPTVGALYANRAQCWLKLGNHEKALDDAQKCTEVDPGNAKGWFRKGLCFHAMKRFPEAIPPLLEAEKIEPTNKQIVEAIKMAQLMARRSAEKS